MSADSAQQLQPLVHSHSIVDSSAQTPSQQAAEQAVDLPCALVSQLSTYEPSHPPTPSSLSTVSASQPPAVSASPASYRLQQHSSASSPLASPRSTIESMPPPPTPHPHRCAIIAINSLSAVSPSPPPSPLSQALQALTSRPWYRRKRYLVPALLLLLLVVGVSVSIGVLYPHPPSITPHSLLIDALSVNLSSSPIVITASLSLSFSLHNPNPYSAHHSTSLFVFSSSAVPLSGSFTIPAGYIAANADEEISTSMQAAVDVRDQQDVAAWQQGVQVTGQGVTAGYVDFLGDDWHIGYDVTSQCQAVLALSLEDWSVAVLQQRCWTGL